MNTQHWLRAFLTLLATCLAVVAFSTSVYADQHRGKGHECPEYSDLDADGNKDLITGKRYYAHNSNDPGGNEPPCLYYYTWDVASKSFHRHTIDEGHVGCGLQIVAEDLNGDSKVDLAVSGKSGTYLLLAQ